MKTDMKRYMKKFTAAAVLMAFLLSIGPTDILIERSWAARTTPEPSSVGSESSGSPVVSKELRPGTFSLPKNLGNVRDLYDAGSDQVVVHIQDAHCNYACQKAIAELLGYLNKEYGASAVNLEGGKEGYDFSVFDRIEDPSIRERASDYLVTEGVVSGAEYFAINNPDKLSLWGIENDKLYFENLNIYRNSLKYKDRVDAIIASLDHALGSLKNRIFTPELLELDKKYAQYKEGTVDFRDYILFLISRAKAHGIEMGPYPNINLLELSLEEEKAIDFKRANIEQGRLIDALQKSMPKKQLEELVTKTIDFQTEKISQAQFHDYLLKKAEMADVKLDELGEFNKYVKYIKTYSAIDKYKTIVEMNGLEAMVRERSYKNDKQRTLDRLSKNFLLTKNIFKIALTKEDYKYYLANKDAFSVINYVRFIEAEAPKYKIRVTLGPEIRDLDRYREEISSFYEYSFRRDDAFLENIKIGARVIPRQSSGQGGQGSRIAVVITGGFHTENLCDLLKNKKISYVSILPNFRSPEGYESPYFTLLAGKRSSLGNVIDKALKYTPDRSTIAVESLFSKMGVDVKNANMLALMLEVFQKVLKGEPCTIQTEWGYVVVSGEKLEGCVTSFETSIGGMGLVANVFVGNAPAEVDTKGSIVLVDGDKMTIEQQEKWIDEIGEKVGTSDLSPAELKGLTDALRSLGLSDSQIDFLLNKPETTGKIKMWNKPLIVRGHAGAKEIYLSQELAGNPVLMATVLIHEVAAAYGVEHRNNLTPQETIDSFVKGKANSVIELAMKGKRSEAGEKRDFAAASTKMVSPERIKAGKKVILKDAERNSSATKAINAVLDEVEALKKPENAKLRSQILGVLQDQHEKTTKMAFLPPDAFHIARVVDNVEGFLRNENLRAALLKVFKGDEKKMRDAVIMAAILSKIGFSHDGLDVDNIATYNNNRLFALELIMKMQRPLMRALDLDRRQFGALVSAIVREGTFGIGTEEDFDRFNVAIREHWKKARKAFPGIGTLPLFNKNKYEDPLTTLLTMAAEADVAKSRLQDWQNNETTLRAIQRVSADPLLMKLYTRRSRLEIEKLKPAEERTRPIGEIDRDIQAIREELTGTLQRLLNREIMKNPRFKSELEQELGKDAGYVYRKIKDHIRSINAMTYLYYISSYAIKEVKINEKGEIVVMRYSDVSPAMGASANLNHVKSYHYDRLMEITRSVNKAGFRPNIRIAEETTRDDDELHEELKAVYKADTHTHLKMSVDFENYIWRIITSTKSGEFKDTITKIQKLLNSLRKRKGLAEDVDLAYLFNSTYAVTNDLLNTALKYGALTERPANPDDIVSAARTLFRREDISDQGKKLIRRQIDLYNSLKYSIRDLFNFQEGSLPFFVTHFMAMSAVFKLTLQDDLNMLKNITRGVLQNYQKDNVAYFEPRFNIGTKDGTLNEILTVIQAYKEWKSEQLAKDPKAFIPEMRIILSITKFDDAFDKTKDERIKHKTDSAKALIAVLQEAKEKAKAKTGYEIRKDGKIVTDVSAVTAQDVLDYVGGLDAAGQEEYNSPDLFYGAFQEMDKYNQDEIEEAKREEREPRIVGMTFHVSESVTDVSMESGIRFAFEAMFMNSIDKITDKTKAVLKRFGHLIVPALVDFDQFRGSTKRESIEQRIAQIKFDLALMERGVPLLAVTEKDLRNELYQLEGDPTKKEIKGKLEEYKDRQTALFKQAAIDKDKEKLAESLKKLEDEFSVEYSYPRDDPKTDDKILDLKTRARYVLDQAIKNGIVVETNPTSNVGISPHIGGFKEHTLGTYLSYTYGAWASDLVRAINARIEAMETTGREGAEAIARYERARSAARAYLSSEDSKNLRDKKVRASVNTDDLTLFGTNMTEELYRVAQEMYRVHGFDTFAEMIENGFDSFIGGKPLSADFTAKVRSSLETFINREKEGLARRIAEAKKVKPSSSYELNERQSEGATIIQTVFGISYDFLPTELDRFMEAYQSIGPRATPNEAIDIMTEHNISMERNGAIRLIRYKASGGNIDILKSPAEFAIKQNFDDKMMAALMETAKKTLADNNSVSPLRQARFERTRDGKLKLLGGVHGVILKAKASVGGTERDVVVKVHVLSEQAAAREIYAHKTLSDGFDADRTEVPEYGGIPRFYGAEKVRLADLRRTGGDELLMKMFKGRMPSEEEIETLSFYVSYMEPVEGAVNADEAASSGIAIRSDAKENLDKIVKRIHDLGFLHRDLGNPSNILVDANGNVWVLDFGLTRSIEQIRGTEKSDLLDTIDMLVRVEVNLDNAAAKTTWDKYLKKIKSLAPETEDTMNYEVMRLADRSRACDLPNRQRYVEDLVKAMRRGENTQVAMLNIQNFKGEFNDIGARIGIGHDMGDYGILAVADMLPKALEDLLRGTGVKAKVYNDGIMFFVIFTNVPAGFDSDTVLEQLLAKSSDFRNSVANDVKRRVAERTMDSEMRKRADSELEGFNWERINFYCGVAALDNAGSMDPVDAADLLDRLAYRLTKYAQIKLDQGVVSQLGQLLEKDSSFTRTMAKMHVQKHLFLGKTARKSAIVRANWANSARMEEDLRIFMDVGIGRGEYTPIFKPVSELYDPDNTFDLLEEGMKSALKLSNSDPARSGRARAARDRYLKKSKYERLGPAVRTRLSRPIIKGKEEFSHLINYILATRPAENVTATFRPGGDEFGKLIWDAKAGKLTIIRFDANNLGKMNSQLGGDLATLIVEEMLREIDSLESTNPADYMKFIYDFFENRNAGANFGDYGYEIDKDEYDYLVRHIEEMFELRRRRGETITEKVEDYVQVRDGKFVLLKIPPVNVIDPENDLNYWTGPTVSAGAITVDARLVSPSDRVYDFGMLQTDADGAAEKAKETMKARQATNNGAISDEAFSEIEGLASVQYKPGLQALSALAMGNQMVRNDIAEFIMRHTRSPTRAPTEAPRVKPAEGKVPSLAGNTVVVEAGAAVEATPASAKQDVKALGEMMTAKAYHNLHGGKTLHHFATGAVPRDKEGNEMLREILASPVSRLKAAGGTFINKQRIANVNINHSMISLDDDVALIENIMAVLDVASSGVDQSRIHYSLAKSLLTKIDSKLRAGDPAYTKLLEDINNKTRSSNFKGGKQYASVAAFLEDAAMLVVLNDIPKGEPKAVLAMPYAKALMEGLGRLNLSHIIRSYEEKGEKAPEDVLREALETYAIALRQISNNNAITADILLGLAKNDWNFFIARVMEIALPGVAPINVNDIKAIFDSELEAMRAL